MKNKLTLKMALPYLGWFLVVFYIFVIWYKRKSKVDELKERETEKGSIFNHYGIIDATEREILDRKAREVSNYLGTAYPKYDPRSWTENEDGAVNVLSGTNGYEYAYAEAIAAIYQNYYTDDRNLFLDMIKFVPPSKLATLEHF